MVLRAVKKQIKVGFGKKETKVEKTVARLQLAQLVSLDELAEEVHDKTGIPVATATTVLSYLPEAISQFIRIGHGVDVGFGILKSSISTGAYDDPTKVTVKKKRFTFRIKSKLRDILDHLSISIAGDETVEVSTDPKKPSGGSGTQPKPDTGGGLGA